MRTYTQGYPAGLKQQVLREFLAGNSIESLRRKYGIAGKMTISKWIRKAGLLSNPPKVYIAAINTVNVKPSKSKKSATEPGSPEDLARQVKELKQQLLEEQVKAKMYHRMIELTEEEFKINILKKDNTK